MHTFISSTLIFYSASLLNKRDMKNELKRARTRVKAGAKSHATLSQTPNSHQRPRISNYLWLPFLQIDFGVFRGHFDISVFQINIY